MKRFIIILLILSFISCQTANTQLKSEAPIEPPEQINTDGMAMITNFMIEILKVVNIISIP